MSVSELENGRWRARYRDAQGKEHAKHFTNKKAAEAWERTQRVNVSEGRTSETSSGRVRLDDYAREWFELQRPRWRPTSVRTYRTAIEGHLLPTLGPTRLARLRPSMVQAWVDSLDLAPATVRLSFGALRSMLDAAVADGLIGSNPCTTVKLPKAQRQTVEVWTPAQVRSIAEAITPELSAAVLLAAGSGLRQSELLGLTVDRVDFLRGEVRIDRQLEPIGPVSYATWGPPKSPESVRVVPVSRSVLAPVSAHLAEYGQSADGLVFSRPDRSPWRNQFARLAMHEALEACGLGGYRIGWHRLRHTYASALIFAGVDVVEVSKRLGHAKVSTTLNTYAHFVNIDDGQRTRDAFDAWLASGE